MVVKYISLCIYMVKYIDIVRYIDIYIMFLMYDKLMW